MALDAKLVIGGLAAALLFLGGGSKSKKSTKPSDTSNGSDDEGKGDLNEPVGPNGCKDGLIEKDGKCVTDPNAKKDPKNGGGTGTLKPSDLVIPKDCKSFKFGDKTGDAWWKSKGAKIAKQWVTSGYTDPLYIAYEMISKTGNCFKSFPLDQNEFENWFAFEAARFDWIKKNRPMWELLWSIRNKIDTELFNGVETVTGEIKNGKLLLKLGKGFDMEAFWNSIKSTAISAVQFEGNNPGSTLGLSNTKPYNDISAAELNAILYTFTVFLPNIPFNEFVALYKKDSTSGTQNQKIWELTLWQEIGDRVSEYAITLDIDHFDPFKE